MREKSTQGHSFRELSKILFCVTPYSLLGLFFGPYFMPNFHGDPQIATIRIHSDNMRSQI